MADSFPPFYLASHSPRRRQLLEQLGLTFDVLAVDVDETPLEDEAPADYVQRLALAKASQAEQGLAMACRRPVLAADTAVVVDRQILGKPHNRDDGLAMMALLSGRKHEVYTGMALVAEQSQLCVNRSTVCFRETTGVEREAYWATGEPHDKAGAYAIQGKGAMFVESLVGSYSGVMGLPLYEAAGLLALAGIRVL